MTYKVTVFALFFGFLKMSDHTVIGSEESKLSNDPSNIKQLTNIHISHICICSSLLSLPAPSL